MIEKRDISLAISSGRVALALPLTSSNDDTTQKIKSSLRLLATMIDHDMASLIPISDREVIVAITSNRHRIGFVWKSMPKGFLLLRGIQSMDDFEDQKCFSKLSLLQKHVEGEAA